ncbi:hypothetical protein PENSPDRAFT_579003 [Peniophora sp. CONT]|nr:hypothetical protein PENSPDRAFT_579003 [Peniophora sp. CONT]
MPFAEGVFGTTCTAEEYAASLPTKDNPYPNITCLSRGQNIGLAFLVQASFLSLLSVFVIYGLIIRNIQRHRRFGKWSLFRLPTDIYMFALLSLDIIQAMGQVLSIRWAYMGKVETGGYCTTQGLFQQFGEAGVAACTLAITMHTFISVFWRKGVHNRRAALIVVGAILLFCSLFVGIGAGVHNDSDAPYITPTPYWCWISARYSGERLGGEYVWLWLALFSSFLVYIPLFLWSEGYLAVDAISWWRFHLTYRHKLEVHGGRRRTVAILAYPVTYSLLVCPVSVIRWIGFGLEARGQSIPSVATFISISIFALSGLSNVLLLVTTRPNLLLFGSVPGVQTDYESSNPSGGDTGSGAGAGMDGVTIGITQETIVDDPIEDMVHFHTRSESRASSSTMVSVVQLAMPATMLKESDSMSHMTQHSESPSTYTASEGHSTGP